MRKLKEMSKDERSLLLFFEHNAVERRGKLSTDYMNAADLGITHEWNDNGFIRFGRVKAADICAGGQQPVQRCAHPYGDREAKT